METPARYVLLDANVIAGYYFPQTLQNCPVAAKRIKMIIDSVKNGNCHGIKLLAGNICIAEAFTVMSKRAITGWEKRPKKEIKGSIDLRTYRKKRQEFADDVHHSKVIEAIELQRYHVLAKHFISPVDHNTVLRDRSRNPLRELGGTDQLIGGMGIWLSRLLGKDRFTILTADYRLGKILKIAKRLTPKRAKKLGLYEVAKEIEMKWWSPDVYPNVIDVERDRDKTLREFFGIWPLLIKKERPIRKRKVTSKDVESLLKLYRAIGVTRDKLPYTYHMSQLRNNFTKATGIAFSEGEIWNLLVSRLKKGGGKLTRN